MSRWEEGTKVIDHPFNREVFLSIEPKGGLGSTAVRPTIYRDSVAEILESRVTSCL